eukprot:Skav220021  [mRNA]  locus=scaffold3413:217691:218905:- [translate_table: standard]
MATQRLQDVLSFLSSLGGLRDGQPQEVQRRLVEGCLRDLMQGPGILLSEATEMANMVNAATLPGWMRDEMLQAVHDKVLGQNNGATKRRNPMQRNMHLYNYFTAEEWEVMRSDTQSLTMKLHTLKKRFQSIGRTCLPQPLRGNAYSQPAVPCPLDIPSLDRLVQVFPARDTHGDVRHVASGRSSVRDDGFKGMLCNALMERFLSGVGGARNSPEGLLMIENGPSYKRKKSALALEDGSVHDHEEKDCKKVKCDEVEIAEKPSETQEPQTQKAKSAEEMAQTIRDQLEANKEKNKSEDNGNVPKTTKPKAKTKAKATAKSKAAQIKTAGSEEHYTVKTLKSKGCPGTKAASPYHLEHATVYTCPNSHSWRVKKCGDKKDRAFSWKKEDPKLTWKRVMGYLEEISA